MPKLRLVLEIDAPEDIPSHEWTAAVRAFNEVRDELMELAEEGKTKGYKICCDVDPFMSLEGLTSGPPWPK